MYKKTALIVLSGFLLAPVSSFAKPPKPTPVVSLESAKKDVYDVLGAGYFTQIVDVTIAADYSAAQGNISFSYLTSQFKSLSFKVLGATYGTTVSGSLASGTFSDAAVVPSLTPNTVYQILVTGQSKTANALYSVNATGGVSAIAYERAIPAVPEPEGWAMMLSGMGLVGFIARRRSGQQA